MGLVLSWYNWLRKEPGTFNATFGWCALTLITMTMYGLFWFSIISLFNISLPEQKGVESMSPDTYLLRSYAMAPAVIWEEVAFRLPLGVMMWILRKRPLWQYAHKHAHKLLAALTLASSMIFGSLHTSSPVPILLQGVLGIGFCWLFLKLGGVRGRMLKPLFFCSIVHISYNHTFNVIDTIRFLASK